MNKLPKIVSLPDVENHTEDIVFGGLGLPMGLDQERIEIYLRNMERVRLSGGLGQLFIQGTRDLDKSSPQVEVDASGAASIKNTLDISANPSAESVPHFDTDVPESGLFFEHQVKSLIKLNLDKRDGILDSSKKPNAFQDPSQHAKFLDRSLRRGLMHASLTVNADRARLAYTAVAYSMLSAGGFLAGLEPKQVLVLDVISRPLGFNGLAAAVYPGVKKKVGGKAKELDVELPSLREAMSALRQSLFWGAHLDRLAMGAGSAALSTFVTSKK